MLEEISQLRLPAKFLSRGWDPLLKQLTPPTETLVQEFYSGIHNVSGPVNFSVYIRGSIIDISPDSFAAAIGIPRVSLPIYPYATTNCSAITTMISFMASRIIRKFTNTCFEVM